MEFCRQSKHRLIHCIEATALLGFALTVGIVGIIIIPAVVAGLVLLLSCWLVVFSLYFWWYQQDYFNYVCSFLQFVLLVKFFKFPLV